MFSKIQIERTIYSSEEHRLLQDALDQFLKTEAVPHYESWEKGQCVPHDFWKKMGEQGFLCLDVSPEYGGSGLDFSFSALVLERVRMAGIDFGIAVHSDIVAPYIEKYGSDYLKHTIYPT